VLCTRGDKEDLRECVSAENENHAEALDDIGEITYPSATILDRVQARLATPDDLPAYAETLVEEVEETKHPSRQLLNRLDGWLTASPRWSINRTASGRRPTIEM